MVDNPKSGESPEIPDQPCTTIWREAGQLKFAHYKDLASLCGPEVMHKNMGQLPPLDRCTFVLDESVQAVDPVRANGQFAEAMHQLRDEVSITSEQILGELKKLCPHPIEIIRTIIKSPPRGGVIGVAFSQFQTDMDNIKFPLPEGAAPNAKPKKLKGEIWAKLPDADGEAVMLYHDFSTDHVRSVESQITTALERFLGKRGEGKWHLDNMSFSGGDFDDENSVRIFPE